MYSWSYSSAESLHIFMLPLPWHFDVAPFFPRDWDSHDVASEKSEQLCNFCIHATLLLSQWICRIFTTLLLGLRWSGFKIKKIFIVRHKISNAIWTIISNSDGCGWDMCVLLTRRYPLIGYDHGWWWLLLSVRISEGGIKF